MTAAASPDLSVADPPTGVLAREPVRVPAWAVTPLAAIILPAAIAWLSGQDVKIVIAGALTATIPLLGAVEVARRAAWAPQSVARVARRSRRAGQLDTIGYLQNLEVPPEKVTPDDVDRPIKRGRPLRARRRR